jgi:hypothetical protein
MKGPFKFIALALIMLVSLAGFSNTMDTDSMYEPLSEPCLSSVTQVLPITMNLELHSVESISDVITLQVNEVFSFDVEFAVTNEVFNYSYTTSFSEDTSRTYFREKCGKAIAHVNYIYRPKA